MRRKVLPGETPPPAPSAEKKPESPPQPQFTEIRRAPVTDKAPVPAKKKQDVADRRRFPIDQKLVAGIASVAIISIVGAYLCLRPEASVSRRGKMGSVFPKDPKLTRIDARNILSSAQSALQPSEPDRDIRRIQRVALDPLRPQAGPIRVVEPVAPLPQRAWIFKGQVYNLVTLEPVLAAQLSFRRLGGSELISTLTDREGLYVVSLPAVSDGGYELQVRRSDYLDGYVDEASPPLKKVALNNRRLLAAEARRNALWVGDLRFPLARDIILIPK